MSELLPNDHDVVTAWIAGLLEGEGCFSVVGQSGTARRRGDVQVNMTDQDVIRRLHVLAGIGNMSGPYAYRTKPTALPRYVWRIARINDVLPFVKTLQPWMGERRQAQIQAVIDFTEANPPTSTACASSQGRWVSPVSPPLARGQEDDAAIAWMAGLMEGEGAFMLPKKTRAGSASPPRYSPQAHMNMTDEDVIRRFYALVEVGNVSGPYNYAHREDRKDFWAWNCHAINDTVAFMRGIQPWMGNRRRAQIDRVLQGYLDQPDSGQNPRPAQDSRWTRGSFSSRRARELHVHAVARDMGDGIQAPTKAARSAPGHGTYSAWSDRRCECDVCAQAKRAYYDARNAARRLDTPLSRRRHPYGQPAEHGAVVMFTRGCRCPLCKDAKRSYERERRLRRKQNQVAVPEPEPPR